MKAVRVKRDYLESFIYILLRDHLPSGTVEEIMEKHVENSPLGFDCGTMRYTNGYLYGHAKDIADRLKAKK